MDNQRVLLVVLDGWGEGPNPQISAIAQAKTPFVDSLYQKYPHSTLDTFGERVGLPKGQMGNSEVGHMNIGAGRIVYQELVRINKAIESNQLIHNKVIQELISYANNNDKAIHLMGLVSDGGVHAHIDHLIAITNLLANAGVKRIFIHAFLDGRDTDPKSGKAFLEKVIKNIPAQAKVASVIGRYYAMDRDKRWDRVKKAYDLLVKGIGEKTEDVLAKIQERYDAGQTDEFIEPIVCVDTKQNPIALIKEEDAVFFTNFRTDRPRELTIMLTQENKPEQGTEILKLYYVTMTKYEENFKGLHIVFEKENLNNTIGEILEKAGKTQLRIAETEKYAHVTFFFNGGKETPFKGEDRIMIPSPKVATYDLKPEMSAAEITDAVVEKINKDQPDFIALNYANTDMVGHTGIFEAAKKAATTVDKCLRKLITAALDHNYQAIVIADHGNSDNMINPDGTPNTAHSMNPVPCFFIGKNAGEYTIKNGKLADIAPTILYLMQLKAPKEMTGEVLVSKK